MNSEYEKTVRNFIQDLASEHIHSFNQGLLLFRCHLGLFDNQSKLDSNNAQLDLTNATHYLRESFVLKESMLKAIWINRNNLLNSPIPDSVIQNQHTTSFPILDLTENEITLISNITTQNKYLFEEIIKTLNSPTISNSQHLQVLYRILINYTILQERHNRDYGQYIH